MAFTSKQTAWERADNKQQALDTKEHEELVDARERAEILKLEQFEREERSRRDDRETTSSKRPSHLREDDRSRATIPLWRGSPSR
jgi:hypothetical protein